jgi:hypothetical protein
LDNTHTAVLKKIPTHYNASILGIGSTVLAMASSSSSIEGSAEGAVEKQPLPSSRLRKKSVLLALVAGVLVVGAIFGGVFGAMAVEKKRRVPIPVEAVTYSMVTEGFVKGAVVPVPNIHTNTADSSPANATTIATTTADKAPAGTGLGGEPSIFSYDYWFGRGGIGAVPMFDPMPLVIPPGAVTVPTWSAAWANGIFANTQGRVVCFAKTGEDVMDMVSGDESACEVVILSNDRFTPYSISKTLNITKPKLLIGRPIYLPMLNCTNHLDRLFDSKSVGFFFGGPLLVLTRIRIPCLIPPPRLIFSCI